ncbi:MAG: hypothetical protein WC632_02365 [Candidatus Margulisiibacteriota bacterium]
MCNIRPIFLGFFFFLVFISQACATYWGPFVPSFPDNNLTVNIQGENKLIVGKDIELEVGYLYSLYNDEINALINDPSSFSIILPPDFSIKSSTLFSKAVPKAAYLIGTPTKEGVYSIKIVTTVPREIQKEIKLRLFREEVINLGFNPDRIPKGYYRNPYFTGVINLVPFPVGIGYFYIDEVFIGKNDPTNNTPMNSMVTRFILPALFSLPLESPYRIFILSAGMLFDTYNCISLVNKKNEYASEFKI